jgi:hypothetical protein
MQITNGLNRDYQVIAEADAIALTLSEPPSQQVTWQLDVYASTPVGRTFVGTINTVSAENSGQCNRLIGYAVCPGARAWNVLAKGAPGSAGKVVGELRVAPVKESPSGAAVGVQRPSGRLLVNGFSPGNTGGEGTFGLAVARTDYVSPIAFTGAYGTNEAALNTVWIMFFDSNAVPPDGTAPYFDLAFRVAAGGTFNFVAPTDGIFFANGMTWAVSSTPGTLTIAATLARVTTNAAW